MATLVTCMRESLIDFVPLNATDQGGSKSGTGEAGPEDREEVLQGVLARSGSSQTVHVSTFPVAVIDTVGAGDTFCAGVLTRLADRAILSRERLLSLTEQELREVISFASAAALNCTREGANPPNRSEVDHYLQRGSWQAS